MKIKKGFLLREMPGGTSVVVGVGENSDKLKGYLTLNESGAFIWKILEKGATVDGVVQEILKEYEVDESVVKADVAAVVAKLKEIGYDGAITIEREISGEKQIEDIKKAKKIIEELWNA